MEAYDVAVIGSGPAALRAAIGVAELGATVIVLSSNPWDGASSSSEFEGITAPLNESSGNALRNDTISAGSFNNDQRTVHRWSSMAAEEVSLLEKIGLPLRRQSDGRLHLSRQPGHSFNRVASAGCQTGRSIIRILENECLRHNILHRTEWIPLHLALDEGAVRGVIGLDSNKGQVQGILSRAIILADEAHGSAWKGSGNEWGFSLSIAMDAGVPLRGIENVAWHPLLVEGSTFPLPFSLLDDGALIRGTDGSCLEFGSGESPEGICIRMINSGNRHVLDARLMDKDGFSWSRELRTSLKSIYNLDIENDVVPIQPGIVSSLGGLLTDERGRVLMGSWNSWATGLWAAGSIGSAGFHGSSYLAGNRLLADVISGSICGKEAGNWVSGRGLGRKEDLQSKLIDLQSSLDEWVSIDVGDSHPRISDLPLRLSKSMMVATHPNSSASEFSEAKKEVDVLSKLIHEVIPESTNLSSNNSLIEALGWRSCVRIAQLTLSSLEERKTRINDHIHLLHSTKSGIQALELRNKSDGGWYVEPPAVQ